MVVFITKGLRGVAAQQVSLVATLIIVGTLEPYKAIKGQILEAGPYTSQGLPFFVATPGLQIVTPVMVREGRSSWPATAKWRHW